MTAALGAAAVAVALVIIAVEAIKERGGLKAAVTASAAVTVPALLLAGWWYARNQRLYGDPTASGALFTKTRRTSDEESWFELLIHPAWYSSKFGHLVRGRSAALDPLALDVALDAWLSVGAMTVVMGAVLVAWLAGVEAGDDRRRSAVGWSVVALLSAVPPVLMAWHVAGGGGPHPRYLLPVLPVVAVAMATLLRRVPLRVGGWLVVVAVAASGLWYLARVREAAAASAWDRSSSWIGQPWRAGMLGLAVVSAVVLVSSLCLLALARDGRTRPEP